MDWDEGLENADEEKRTPVHLSTREQRFLDWFGHLSKDARDNILELEGRDILGIIKMGRLFGTASVAGRALKWLFISTLGLWVIVNQFWQQIDALKARLGWH